MRAAAAASPEALLWSRLWPEDAPAAVLSALIARAQVRSLPAGAALYAAGDAATGLYGVLRGLVRNVHVAADGKELLFGLFGPGTWFGEVSLFDDAPRPLHAYAQGPTELLHIPTADFHTVLAEHPEGYRHFAKVICHKLRLALDALEDQQRPLTQRLAKRLLDLASVYGRPEPKGLVLSLKLPQEELARMLAASRQSVNKTLQALQRQGLVAQHKGHLCITDATGLRAVAALVTHTAGTLPAHG